MAARERINAGCAVIHYGHWAAIRFPLSDTYACHVGGFLPAVFAYDKSWIIRHGNRFGRFSCSDTRSDTRRFPVPKTNGSAYEPGCRKSEKHIVSRRRFCLESTAYYSKKRQSVMPRRSFSERIGQAAQKRSCRNDIPHIAPGRSGPGRCAVYMFMLSPAAGAQALLPAVGPSPV